MSPSSQIIENLPVYARLSDEAGLLQHLADAVQPDIEESIRLIDSQFYLFDPAVAPARFLDYLGQYIGLAPIGTIWQGLGLNPAWTDAYKRKVILRAWNYFHRKGTLQGIREAIDLWLQFPGAQTDRLVIRLPFGKHPTDHPPNWWTYDTPYGAHLNQTYVERQHFGSGDYPGTTYRPDWFTLQAENQWLYGETWNQHELTQVLAPLISDRSSHLGPERPWEHLSLTPENWNLIFPDIYKLNPEIWNAHADVTTFGWLNLSLLEAVRIEKTDLVPTLETLTDLEVDGAQYGDGIYGGDWFPYATAPAGTEVVTTEITTEFGNYPGWQYNWSSFGSVGGQPLDVIEGSGTPAVSAPVVTEQWWANFRVVTETVTSVVATPAVPCQTGITIAIIDGMVDQLTPGIPAEPATQFVDYVPGGETTVVIAPATAGFVGFAWYDQWLSLEDSPYTLGVTYENTEIETLALNDPLSLGSDWRTLEFAPLPELDIAIQPLETFDFTDNDLSIDLSPGLQTFEIESLVASVETLETGTFSFPEALTEIATLNPPALLLGFAVDWANNDSLETVTIDWGRSELILVRRYDGDSLTLDDFWQSQAQAEVTQTTTFPGYYVLDDPFNVALYEHEVWNSGVQWYFGGRAEVAPTVIQVPSYQNVQLCNVFKAWSTRTIIYWYEYEIDLPLTELPLFELYPIIGQVSEGRNWRLLLETTEEVYVLAPVTMFWSDVLGSGIPAQRSQSIDLENGVTNLYLEFIVQPQVASKLRSASLTLGETVIRSVAFIDPLHFSDPGCFGFRFAVPLRFNDEVETLESLQLESLLLLS